MGRWTFTTEPADRGKKDWDESLPLVVATCIFASTGLTPDCLMLRREAYLGHDIVFGVAAARWEVKDPMDYLAGLEEGLQSVQTQALKHFRDQQARQKGTTTFRQWNRLTAPML